MSITMLMLTHATFSHSLQSVANRTLLVQVPSAVLSKVSISPFGAEEITTNCSLLPDAIAVTNAIMSSTE